jgi:hypothetical protein
MIQNGHANVKSRYGVFTEREMRLLSLVTLAAISLLLIVSTITFSQRQKGEIDFGWLRQLEEGQLHPAILPITALKGGNLDGTHTVLDAFRSPPAMESLPFAAHPERTGGITQPPRFRQKKLRLIPIASPMPLPLPAPGPPPKGRPKPCFKDC